MTHIIWFRDITKDSIASTGGKGANLGELWNAKAPVPPGFVISASAYQFFIKESQLGEKIRTILKNIIVENTADLQASAESIQQVIQKAPMPKEMGESIVEAYATLSLGNRSSAEKVVKAEEEFVAVRSSATAEDLPNASFAGQQATLLNVRGKESLLNAVKECWSSLFTARAIYYREKNGFIHDQVLIAVIVQKMVNSEKSGVMFTINPVTNNPEEMVIEAGWGLGEAIVSGAINPNTYIIDKKTRELKESVIPAQKFKIIRDRTGSNRQKALSPTEQKLRVLNDKEIRDLVRLGKKIEGHYGTPQDIEWACEKDELYIVQTRAVTTLNKKYGEERSADREENILLKGQTASAGIAYGPVCVVKDAQELDKVKKGDILVTAMTNPDMVPAMEKAAAIITDEGGMTSHAAIVSREMGIPCIVGTETATRTLEDGQEVTVDAARGIVYKEIIKQEETKNEEKNAKATAEFPKTKTKIKVNIAFPRLAEQIAQATQADGVGLLRLEFIVAGGSIHPAQYIRENKEDEYTALLVREIGKVARAFAGKPVWARNSDARTDEYRNLKGGDKEPKESDPMIGWHGIRRLLDEPHILKAEFKAIKLLHKQGLTNVGIMLPFVINVEEIRKAKQILREVGLEPHKDVQFGVMIETPAACWIIKKICQEGVDFVSFGTNDLTQLTLGIDRNNTRIQKHFSEMHPAVVGEMVMVLSVCRKYKVETSICGQAASHPNMAQFLVRHQVDSISANPDAVNKIREVVAEVERKEKR